MKNVVFIAGLLIAATAQAGELKGQGNLVDGLNRHLQSAQQAPAAIDRPQEIVSDPTGAPLPNWGIVVKGKDGKVLDVFGQVDYNVTNAGMVSVPGYKPPSGSTLQIVPQAQYISAMKQTAGEGLSPMFQPLTAIPSVVTKATDYLANELCGRKGRPSTMNLSIVVSASGSILFATAGTEAGSEVGWEFGDVCKRYALEGDSIPFRD
ncbi:hypothetical protein [Brucella sp. NBRC 113783]|uniref:hypothetical protein n=1 Tax=Brucella sp. NBRC 113783 TaxID=3075478 RepID=UPI0029C0C04B|nr:hypothetical protein [Brucella sp. NBRC 113783]MDX4072525.1 hypothetical protein [Brucella sp. NBRC 113783]